MAYTRPPYNAYNVTWLNTDAYASPAATATDFNLSDYRLIIPTSIATFENYQITVGIAVDVYLEVQLSVPLEIATYANYQVSIPLSLATFELYSLTVPLKIAVEDLLQPVIPISLLVYETYDIQIPLGVLVYELVQLSIPIAISRASANWSLKIPLGIQTFGYHQLSIPLSIDVTPPSLQLAVPLQLSVYETSALAISLKVAVVPAFASGTGGQGVGKVIDLPVDNYQRWSLRVTLGGIDVSSRLTGELSVDAEESSAKVAVFSLRPSSGQVNPYAWVKAPVEIFYVINDSSGFYLSEVLLFKGLVDTPVYDATSRITEFTCTDDLQNVILGMSQGQIDLLTPLASYSKYIFDTKANSWDYLQDRLSTYPYAVHLNANRQPVAYNYKSGLIDYEFQSDAILDGSLSVTLANAREITNSVTVSMDIQMDTYRETIAILMWEDHNFGGVFPDWWMNTPEQILSAIAGTEAKFVSDPMFKMIPESQTMRDGIVKYNFMNYGQALLTTAFRGMVSKRFTQTLTFNRLAQIGDSPSISQLGALGAHVSGSVVVEYDAAIAPAFEKTVDKSGWLCSAGRGYQIPRASSVPSASDPKLFVSDGSLGGWVPYPLFQVQYPMWDNSSTVLGNIHQYKRMLISDGTLMNVESIFNSDYGGISGEFIYDFEDFVLSGTQEEREEAYDCLVAQAKQTVLASHRQNRVSFTTFINPMIERGMTLRVACDTLYATGKVYQISHTFDIENGSALTNITLAVSSSKAIGLSGGTELFLTIPLLIRISTEVAQSPIPVDNDSMTYYVTLVTRYNGQSSDDYVFGPNGWGGFFTGPTGPGEFAVEFPALSEQNTGNTRVTLPADTIEAGVPNDEFLLFA